MTQPEPPNEPQTLQYATPAKRRVPFPAQMALGFAAFFATVTVSVVLIIILNNTGSATTTTTQLAIYIPMGLLLIFGLAVLVRWRFPGFFVGILTGLLLVGLIIGGLILLVMSICGGLFNAH